MSDNKEKTLADVHNELSDIWVQAQQTCEAVHDVNRMNKEIHSVLSKILDQLVHITGVQPVPDEED